MLHRAALLVGVFLPVSRGFVPGAFATSSNLRRSKISMATQDELKKQVGYKAVDDYVESGMIVGLGTGSTAAFAVERVGELLKSGKLKDIIPSRLRSARGSRP